MYSLDELAKIVTDIAEKEKSTGQVNYAAIKIRLILYYHIDEVLKMIKNINETSLPGRDRLERIIEMETKFGIPKTHLL